jgi:hypothetical protein
MTIDPPIRPCFSSLHAHMPKPFYFSRVSFSSFLNFVQTTSSLIKICAKMILKAPVARHYDGLQSDNSKKLTLFFATLCVIDLFGVFPIVTLPRSLISCGYYAMPLILLVFSLQTYTAQVLGRCWIIAEKLDPSIIEKNRYAYAAM